MPTNTIIHRSSQTTRRVISSRNDPASPWRSVLYVNNGETITNIAATHRTEKGAQKWAYKQMFGQP